MFSSKKIMFSKIYSSSSSSSNCPKQIIPISACRILNENNNTTGFNIKWRISDDSYLDSNGERYSYGWQFCSKLPLVNGPDSNLLHCTAPFDIIDGQPVSLQVFESPNPEQDGSFSKTFIISQEGLSYDPRDESSTYPYNYQDEINLAVHLELAINNGREEFGDCWWNKINVDC